MSPERATRHGRTTVAAWAAIRTPGPLRAFGERIRARRGANIATVAVARKLAVLCWHLLTRGGGPTPSLDPPWSGRRCRLLELAAGDARRIGYRNPVRVFATPAQHRLERQVGAQAEKAYRRFVKDFLATGKKGAGAITGARNSVPRKGQAARQEQAPDPAL